MVTRARDPRLPHVTLGLTADRAPDIYTVQLWNYNRPIYLEAVLLSEDEIPRDHDVQWDQQLYWTTKHFAFCFWSTKVEIFVDLDVVAVSTYLHLYKETKGENESFILIMDEIVVPKMLKRIEVYSYIPLLGYSDAQRSCLSIPIQLLEWLS